MPIPLSLTIPGTLISTGGNQPGVAQLGGGLATNGIIARNTLWNANAAQQGQTARLGWRCPSSAPARA